MGMMMVTMTRMRTINKALPAVSLLAADINSA